MLVNGIDYDERTRDLTTAGIDPWGTDDTAFNVQFVFCNQHLRAHATGWCTIANIEKTPLPDAFNAEQARVAYRALGLLGEWDPRACNHCGTQVVLSPISGEGYRDAAKSLLCDPTDKRARRHDGTRH